MNENDVRLINGMVKVGLGLSIDKGKLGKRWEADMHVWPNDQGKEEVSEPGNTNDRKKADVEPELVGVKEPEA